MMIAFRRFPDLASATSVLVKLEPPSLRYSTVPLSYARILVTLKLA